LYTAARGQRSATPGENDRSGGKGSTTDPMGNERHA
jgi:hypothetical protein